MGYGTVRCAGVVHGKHADRRGERRIRAESFRGRKRAEGAVCHGFEPADAGIGIGARDQDRRAEPKGSDYAAAAGEASKELVFPAVAEGDKATLTVYAAGSGSLTAAWVGAAGQSVHQYSGDRVTTIDLGDVPKDASALKITADTKVTADVTVSRDGNGNQSDFALIAPRRQTTGRPPSFPPVLTAV